MYTRNCDLRSPTVTKISSEISLSWLRINLLVFIDSLALSVAWVIADKLGTPVEKFNFLLKLDQQLGFLLTMLVINLGILAASGCYGSDDKKRSYINLSKSLTLGQTILLITAFLYQPEVGISRSVFLLAWLLTIIFVNAERLLIQLAIVSLRSKNVAFQKRVFLLGNPEDTEKAKKLLGRTKQFNIQGAADLSVRSNPEQWSDTLEKIRNWRVSEIFICSWQSVKDPIIFFWELKSAGIQLRVLPISLELPQQWSDIKMIDGFTTIRFSSPPIIGGDFWLKRAFDLVASSIILLLISLPMSLIAILIKLDSPGPIFYKQNRVGLKNCHFQVWKFRTMVINADKLQKELEAQNEVKGGVLFKIKDDPRITKVGKFLRRYSLDELPQLFNVLRGEMSLVGPRPLPVRDVEKFAEHHFLRQEVLPGITGLWQVGGRSDVNSDEVFSLDMTYIQHWSLALDFKILLKTIKVVLLKEGAY
ncbi:exopolysaccharide biosynthesis polyprenyl glycosylphosphotransferase [Lyngbya aestuarii]|uniref:exopolysaccharide biosynthesis polyprenyl glycosylphosphotransferase n=1 Tax=Lyngbya aestuarii TaxID=118322 RepID=UPI00403D5663